MLQQIPTITWHSLTQEHGLLAMPSEIFNVSMNANLANKRDK